MQQLRTILSLPKQTGILFRKIKMHVDTATRIFTVRTVLLIIRVTGTVIPVAARGIGNRPQFHSSKRRRRNRTTGF